MRSSVGGFSKGSGFGFGWSFWSWSEDLGIAEGFLARAGQ